jgi:hypothetical protein
MSTQDAIINAQTELLQIQHMYNDTYKTLLSSPDKIQQSNLAMKVKAMRTRLQEMKMETEAYDRQYVDVSHSGKKPTIWQRNGLSTAQDWVLFLFFTVYGLFVVGLLIAVGLSGGNVMANTFITLLGAFLFGIMASVIIMRYG